MWPATVALITLLVLVFSFAMWVAHLGSKTSEAGKGLATHGQTNIDATVNPAAMGVTQSSTIVTTQASVGVQGNAPGPQGATGPAAPGPQGATGPQWPTAAPLAQLAPQTKRSPGDRT